MTRNLIVIGAGMASGRMLEHLFETQPGEWNVTLFNAEPRGNYNRLMLSPVLSGDKTYAEIVTHDDDWYAAQSVTCRFGEKVQRIDRERRVVIGERGELAYDRLVMATGSNPFMIPLPGHDLQGVIPYRDLDDTERMMGLAKKPGAKAVVIGGGLLGLEAAAGMAARGVDVTVIHVMGHLMERQLDEAAGYLLKKALEAKGITVLTSANSSEIIGTDGHVSGLRLDDGRVIACDLLVMAVGIRPNVALAKEAGLAVGRGIHVDDAMITSDPNILAIGECVEHQGAVFGLVAPLYDQARVAADTLGDTPASFAPKEVATKLKVTGCDLFSAGDFADADDREDIIFRDPARGIYKRLVLEGQRLIGAVMYGDTGDGPWFHGLIKDRTDISDMRDTLIFGPAFQGGAQADPLAAVAALPADAEICGCNGICKSRIVDAIQGGARTLTDVREQTKASASCGTCTGLVEQVMAMTLGDSFEVETVKPMCSCTSLTHMDVRRLIKSRELKSMAAVMQECGWKTSCGCASCRPALNYYLLCDWPGEYRDDDQSRFVNERMHSNIQKDGTYSVVPRMWGGITTADELRAIADAADKYQVQTVKVTGGQRIDLLGVKKQDLPDIWADLNAAGMVSGQAYAKGLRTVKTCVGTDHCRFGTQDSTGLGIRLEKALWGAWTPAKVKMAVSGCPRNCAESTCKDVGVICVDSGYILHIGGAAGLHIQGTVIMCTVKTEDEVMEYCAAVIQLYREEAAYLERMYKWLDNVGLDHIVERVVTDGDSRKALAERFHFAQQFMQQDPWAERTKASYRELYSPLADLTMEAAE
ncbi:nitrite reductase large subunit NirB [Paracoccus seriniphilus]|uniref:Assimilatory nitrite reductase (NAD(P)H) large subunit n=1 Tax=Paracoccus seriniphilus TaxID=184748 RepID=A0A239PR91_9RHOB|nr:nitrite reductase large subunit NirB [Paracoccus seriniphilus]WCR12775.1 NAD(P)/FAD-dependent oxidoreductase [Paracoccus seriniphilus]SNT72811.1 assimilatory nitrite reductase (NAD(P)H) large subunit precursor [Paracoccus seriniphilus]